METIQLIFPVVAAGIIWPVVEWTKKWMPLDFPIKPVFVASCLSLGVTYLLSYWFAPEMTSEQIVAFALGGQVLSQYGHAVKKTVKREG